MRQKARAGRSAAGDPEVQWTADAGYSSAAQPTMLGPVEVESSPQVCALNLAAQVEGFKPRKPNVPAFGEIPGRSTAE